MYSITLFDGTIISDLTMNGNNFISNSEVFKEMFSSNNLTSVVINGPDGQEKHGPMHLVYFQHRGNEWWFVISDLTQSEIREQEMEHMNKLLQQQVEALSGQNTFLEDCIAEMASVVYA